MPNYTFVYNLTFEFSSRMVYPMYSHFRFKFLGEIVLCTSAVFMI